MGEVTRAPGRAARGWSAWWIVAAAVPVLATAVVAATRRWWPTSDLAVEYLRTTDVGTRHTPLVGPYSRFLFNHPGPAMYYLFAPFTFLLGPVGMFVATGLLNVVCIVSSVAIVRRRAGALGAATLAFVLLVVLRAMGPELWVDPWNPWLAVFPFLLTCVGVWSVVDGDLVVLPVVVGAGTFALQADAEYLLLIASMALVTGIGLVVHRDRIRSCNRRTVRRVVGGRRSCSWSCGSLRWCSRRPGARGTWSCCGGTPGARRASCSVSAAPPARLPPRSLPRARGSPVEISIRPSTSPRRPSCGSWWSRRSPHASRSRPHGRVLVI